MDGALERNVRLISYLEKALDLELEALEDLNMKLPDSELYFRKKYEEFCFIILKSFCN